MSEKRTVFGIIGVVCFLSMFLLYVVWRTPVAVDKVTPSSNKTAIEPLSNQSQASDLPPLSFAERILIPFQGAWEPIEDLIKGENEDGQAKTSSSVSDSPSALSEQQIFERLWPPTYQTGLQRIETLMADDGFIRKDEVHANISSDSDVYVILSKLIDYTEKKGWTASGDAAKLRQGLTVDLPQQIDAERRALQVTGMETRSLLPRDQRVKAEDGQSLAVNIIDGLKYVFSARYAEAGWHTLPDCYKDDQEFNPIPGFNSIAICCNCGCRYDGYSCEYVEDCGTNSVLCDIPFGCLNLNCGLWPNAIWDSFTDPLGTGICGCG